MTIEGLEFNADLQEILDELVAQLRANGIEYIQKMIPTATHVQICCPYHKDGMERKPSAGIRREDGMFHCFTCGEVHSLPEVISHCFGKDSMGTFGWQWLLKNYVSVSREERKDVSLDLVRNQVGRKYDTVNSTADNTSRNDREYISEEELDKYRYIHPYMYERKLTDEVIEMFDVGYDRDTECITFPVRDVSGRCLYVARRSVKTKYFNYPKGAEKPLYGLYELYKYRPQETEIIVCESMIDILTAWSYGRCGVALNGLGSSQQFEMLRNLPYRKLILATDMDDAGLSARYNIRKNVKNKIITELIWDRDMAKDLNDMSKEQFLGLSEVF